ncbi:MAG: acetate kinase, partial [Cyanobacteriota bacterium]|nr:acetate kinase [Cyanobacteriota bacterium]
MKILVLNAGSSTQKSCLYDISGSALPESPPEPLWEGTIDWGKSTQGAEFTVKANRCKYETTIAVDSRSSALAKLLDTLTCGDTAVLDSLKEIAIVGHRVVHGGTEYSQSTPISTAVKEAIAQLIPLAPSHNPAHLEGIEAIEQALPETPQLAVFDTA